MSYHIGFSFSERDSEGKLIRASAGEPYIKCDTCGKQLFFRKKNGMAPDWFLNGEAPPKWKKDQAIHPITGEVSRRDYCQECKTKL